MLTGTQVKGVSEEGYRLEVGRRIKLVRLSHELLAREFAEKVGVRAETVSRWENGRTLPSPWDIYRIAHIFRMPTDELCDPASSPDTILERYEDMFARLKQLHWTEQVGGIQRMREFRQLLNRTDDGG